MNKDDTRILIENFTSPGHKQHVDRAKYMAMHDALMKILPPDAPGLTVADAKTALLAHLSQEHFPNGEKAGWWLKAVQLDLEAKGVIARAPKSPVRLHKVKSARSE
jgi:hypothetical protein